MCHFCYSDELLFEEDAPDVSSRTSGVTNGMHPNHTLDSSSITGEVGKLNLCCSMSHSGASISTNLRYTAYSFPLKHLFPWMTYF